MKNILCFGVLLLTAGQAICQDHEADNMLIYQRSVGGWPKHINEVKVDYTKTLLEEQRHDVIADSLRKDATIDNGATIKEIRHLAKAYKQHQNPSYLQAVEKGIRYLLKAQHSTGGWPQFYPDSSLYRGQITYNDNAMINVLNLLTDVSKGKNDLDIVSKSYIPAVNKAINKGVECILLTQVKVNGKLTAWCAQHDRNTLKPVNARKFELASLSGMETVGILEFLMRLENPSKEVKESIASGVQWLEKVKLQGLAYVDVPDSTQPKGRDRVIKPDANSTIWARFYEIETNEPFFCGRDGIKKKAVKDIEVERRTGYAWYGKWPQKLLNEEYPNWKKKVNI